MNFTSNNEFSLDLNEVYGITTTHTLVACGLFVILLCATLVQSRDKGMILDTGLRERLDTIAKGLPLHNDDNEFKNKLMSRLFAICGQSVRQQNGALNIHLRQKFLDVSSPGDNAIFAGTPQEKNVFFEGYTHYEEFNYGDVTFTLYNLEGRIVYTLKEHHSRKSIHNCVEVLWSLIALKSVKHVSWTSVHGLMYDNSQCVRTSRILCLENEHYEEYIKENTDSFREGPPLQQCQTNKARLEAASYWKTNGCDIEKLFREVTESVSLVMTDSSFSTMLDIFTNVSQCYHIGCVDKQIVETNLVQKWGAGYNYGDLCDLLPEDFTMDGDRQKGASDS
tara:strand:- start:1369 stop:2376 length:1008 start_codon:yes stop_codon:yes gene_type:complete